MDAARTVDLRCGGRVPGLGVPTAPGEGSGRGPGPGTAHVRGGAQRSITSPAGREGPVGTLRPMTPPDARAAAFFDLDRTLIAGASTFAFAMAAWRSDLVEGRDLARDAGRALSFRLFGASDERTAEVRDRMLGAVVGASRDELVALNDELVPRLLGRVRPESRALVELHHEHGRDSWIVSASPHELVEPLAAAIGMTGAIGTRSEVVDGRFTGALEGPFVYGPGKAEAIAALVDERGYDLRLSYAYSDSASDLPMLELVGHPVAVNPDRELERVARRRGWPIVVFAQRTKRVVGATGAVVGASALAGAAYAAGRHRGRLVADAAVGRAHHH